MPPTMPTTVTRFYRMSRADARTNGVAGSVAIAETDFGQCPLPISNHDTVQLGHGSGGKMSSDLIAKLFLWAFDNPALARLDDSSIIEVGGSRLAISTDSFIVDPIFFPGGDIGDLAINGTVNDLAMAGARAIAISVGVVVISASRPAKMATSAN